MGYRSAVTNPFGNHNLSMNQVTPRLPVQRVFTRVGTAAFRAQPPPLLRGSHGTAANRRRGTGTLGQDLLAERLMAVEVVAEPGDTPWGVRQPAGARRQFAILLGVAILRGDERRGQWEHRLLSRGEQDLGDGRVVVLDCGSGERARAAIGQGIASEAKYCVPSAPPENR